MKRIFRPGYFPGPSRFNSIGHFLVAYAALIAFPFYVLAVLLTARWIGSTAYTYLMGLFGY